MLQLIREELLLFRMYLRMTSTYSCTCYTHQPINLDVFLFTRILSETKTVGLTVETVPKSDYVYSIFIFRRKYLKL